MTNLPKTSDVLAALRANQYHSAGEHLEDTLRVGGSGFQVGTANFDPASHEQSDIDKHSIFGLATGVEQVRLMMPERPLKTSVIADTRGPKSRAENPGLAVAKRALAIDLAIAIDEAMPGITDKTDMYVIGNDAQKEWEQFGAETLPDDEQALRRELSDIAMDSLTFVVSSFTNLSLPDKQPDASIVAVKVNHPSERRLMANRGVLRIVGLGEVNTDKKKKLDQANNTLANRHQNIVEKLQAQGAGVASVEARPGSEPIYDAESADSEVAAAIGWLN